jgi:chromodomain-helicase-DNA-binding protein 7
MQIGDIALRQHQAESVSKFLDKRACLIGYGKRGGKTITALALTLRRLETADTIGPTLIISDKDSPWTRDVAQIGIPKDQLHLIFGGESDHSSRLKAKSVFRGLLESPQPGHFYQIHWAGLVPDFERLAKTNWFAIIADEAHAAKNRKAKRTKALKALHTRYKIALTADPSDNAPQDMWSLLNWLYPKQYTSFWKWVRQYVEVSSKTGRHGDYFKFGAPINVEEFHKEIEPFVVVMGLEEIDPGQVDHIYEEVHVDMTPEQEQAYVSMLEWQLMELGDDVVISEWPMTNYMKLQQLAQAYGEAERKQVWRWVNEDGKKVRKQVETVTIHQCEPSPKLDAIMDRLQVGDTGPTIIFSQYRGMVRLLCKRLDDAGIKYVSVLDQAESNEAEKAFQGGQFDLIVGTTGLMSESIELGRAATVMFCDCPENPRVLGQAIGRAQVYGKRTPIRVIHFRTRGTVDSLRLDRVRTKQQWKEALLGREVFSNSQH